MNLTAVRTCFQPLEWRVRGERRVPLDRPRFMGILNVTPDSFSDGGAHATVDAAVDAALHMISDGAAIIDVGGESTRPGAADVGEHEQIERTAMLADLRVDLTGAVRPRGRLASDRLAAGAGD
jgi:hypothetical protein